MSKITLATIATIATITVATIAVTIIPIPDGLAQLLPVYRMPSKTVGIKSLELNFSNSYFITTEHYNYVGERVALAEEESFYKVDSELIAAYGATKNFDLLTGLRYRMNSSSISDDKNQLVDGKNSNFESVFAGIKYSFYQKLLWSMASEFFYRMATYQNSPAASRQSGRFASKIVLGDDGSEFAARFYLSKVMYPNLYFSTFITYLIPRDLSQEIGYSWELSYAWKYLAILGGIKGTYSLETDEYSNNPDDKPPINTGSTYLFNSVNRDYWLPWAGLNFKIATNWRIGFRISKIMGGYSTDGGNEFLLTLTWKNGGYSNRQIVEREFKEYDVEASVIKISPKEGFIVVDKGYSQDLEKGMSVDVYKFDYMGGNILVASGYVFSSTADSSIVKVVEMYRKIPLEIGQLVRGRRGVDKQAGGDDF